MHRYPAAPVARFAIPDSPGVVFLQRYSRDRWIHDAWRQDQRGADGDRRRVARRELDGGRMVTRSLRCAPWMLLLALACGAPDSGSRAEPEPASAPAQDSTEAATANASETPAPPEGPSARADSVPPAPREILVYFTRDEEPYPVSRDVGDRPDVLTAALEELLRGPTPEERAAGIHSWFSTATAGMLISATVDEAGHAVIDFRDFRSVIPNASSSAGSTMLLGEINGTVGQFPSIRSAEYRIQGSCEAFWNFLQRGCEVVRFPDR